MANILAKRTEVITSEHDHSPEERQMLARVRADKELSEKGRKPYEDRWHTWAGLHRNVQRLADAHASTTTEPGRDAVMGDAKREFGVELFVPKIFTVIETMTPALLMNNPRMKVKPRHKSLDREKAEAVKMMFEERQREIDYSLKLIPTARSALKYGLGVSKNFWDVKEREMMRLESNDLRARVMKPYVKRETDVNEGPNTEAVDILNFFWDPAAENMETCRYAIHRTWRDMSYIAERIKRRDWAPIELDAIKQSAPETSRDSVLNPRRDAIGLDIPQDGTDREGDGKLHEVWEWHNGQNMVTVLDGKFVVQAGENPFAHGELPFSIFRPTLQEHEFVGIGEIEPIVSLQQELNAMRSLRLDNAYLLVHKAFLYADGLVDPADFVVGPGRGIPVEGGSIDDVIKPIQFGELSGSGYQEEAALNNDIETASGISEVAAGGQGTGNASETATGIQMMDTAMGRRVELRARLLTHELITNDSRQHLEMYRQHMLLKPREIAIDTPQGYEWVSITGQDLDLVEAVLPEDESTMPENLPQKRNDALALSNQMQPYISSGIVDPRWAARALLNAFDVPDVDSAILPEQTLMNPQVGAVVAASVRNALMEEGVDEQTAEDLAARALEEAMANAGVSAPVGAMSENGAGPAPPGEEPVNV